MIFYCPILSNVRNDPLKGTGLRIPFQFNIPFRWLQLESIIKSFYLIIIIIMDT